MQYYSIVKNAEKVTIFYHDPCLDGAAAAWAAYKKWKDTALYVGINHASIEATQQLIRRNIDGNTLVIFADFSPPRTILDELAAASESIEIYDHHASAIRDLAGYKNEKVSMYMDVGRSGGAILHDALFGNCKRPQVIEHAQMIDLEQTSRRNFFPIAAYYDSLSLSDINEIVASLNDVDKTPLDKIVARGQSIRRSNSTAIEKAMESRVWTKVAILLGTQPVYVPMINTNLQFMGREYSIRLRQLAEATAPGFVAFSWWEDKGIVRLSVRSNGMPDAGQVASHLGNKALGHGLGGGGHPTSAAAQFTVEQFNRMFPRITQQEAVQALQSTAAASVPS